MGTINEPTQNFLMTNESENKVLQGRVEVTDLPGKSTIEGSPEVDSARQSTKDEVQKVLDANPDKHTGSAGGTAQKASIEFVIKDTDGHETVAFSRTVDRTESEVEKLEARKRPISLDELQRKSTEGDIAATKLLIRFEGFTTPEEKAAVQKEADQLYGRGQFSGDNFAQNSFAHEVDHFQNLDAIPNGQDREPRVELEVSAHLLPRSKEVIAETPKEQPLTNTPEGWLAAGKKISELPFDKQVEVLGAGLLTGLQTIAEDQKQRSFGQLIGTVEGVGNVAQNLAKIADFGAALILNDKEKAGKLGEEFGTSVGQTIVSGVQLFRAADAYFYNVGYTGDYAKPFRDVYRAGAVMNEEWSKKTPFEQERIKSKFVAELVADGLVGGAAAGAIKKAGKFTEVLDIVADEAKVWNAATEPTRKKAVHAINNAINDVMQPAAETTTGMKMHIPKEKVSLEDYYAKMHGKPGSGHPGDEIFRGDKAPYSSINQKGRRKAFVNMEGDLCPADPKGMYRGKEVTVGHHVDGDWNTAIKGHSPYISFSADDGVAKWGDKTIKLNYKELRRAIAAGEVKDVEILELPQILKGIDECPLSEVAKVKLRHRAIKHNEILIKGKVPQRFFTVSEPPPEM